MSEAQLVPQQRYAPGTFCWADLGTPDPEGAKRFYTELFQWTVEDVPAGEGIVYSMLRQGGGDVGALYRQALRQGAPPAWLTYVTVEDVDRAAARARELGGTVVMEPLDVMDAGRMAAVQDPTGAVVALWEAGRHGGAAVLNRPGGMCWVELLTRDGDAARAFYTGLFGWGTQAMEIQGMPYTVFTRGEESAGGMVQIQAEWGEMEPHWMLYFWVENCDRTAARAAELGGRVMAGPDNVPGVGRFALLQDPQGAAFGVLTMAASV